MDTPGNTDITPAWRAWRLFLGRCIRIIRWEYWPTLPLYLPVLPVVIFQALRYRSLGLITAANPGMPSGGFVLDSKSSILRALSPSGRVAPFGVIPATLPPEQRTARLREIMAEKFIAFPLVLKPDFGERGNDVLIARDEIRCEVYLKKASGDTIVQKFIPGVEYGVFYERIPGTEKGKITGITHKSVTLVTGDGHSTLERLILADNRAVALALFFLETHKTRLREIIPEGKTLALNLIGTHSRGSLFLDACDAVTGEMEAAIEQCSRHFHGFHFGRYDIRCPSLEALRNGLEFHIVELNGVTSEPTHIYDPRHGLLHAWIQLSRQWARAYRIAALNRANGHTPMSASELFSRIRRSRKTPQTLLTRLP